MKKFILLFIIISLKGFSYEIGSSYISISPSYQRGDFHSKIKNDKINSFYSEKIKDINNTALDFEAQKCFFDNFLIQLNAAFAFGSSHNSYLNLLSPIGETPFQLSTLANFSYDTDTYRWKIGARLGYHYRLGAIVLQPKIGFSYNDLKFKRQKISLYPFSNQQLTTTITGTIFPYNDVSCHWYSPLLGIDLIFLIDPYSNWNLLASYEYLIGPANFSTNYLHDETVTTPIATKLLFYNEKQKSTKYGDGHFLDLGIRYSPNKWLFFQLGFQYEHFRIFSKNIKAGWKGYSIENNILTNNNFLIESSLSRLRYQSFNFYLSLALQY